MTPIEKLARRICWAEFEGRNKETTEARYWREIHPETREAFLQEAKRFKWIIRSLDRSRDGWKLAEMSGP